jgi:hypothetical protein
MRRLDRRLTAWADAHPITAAITTGLVVGLVAFLLLWLILRDQVWGGFGALLGCAVGAGAATYTRAFFRRKDREVLERRRHGPD